MSQSQPPQETGSDTIVDGVPLVESYPGLGVSADALVGVAAWADYLKLVPQRKAGHRRVPSAVELWPSTKCPAKLIAIGNAYVPPPSDHKHRTSANSEPDGQVREHSDTVIKDYSGDTTGTTVLLSDPNKPAWNFMPKLTLKYPPHCLPSDLYARSCQEFWHKLQSYYPTYTHGWMDACMPIRGSDGVLDYRGNTFPLCWNVGDRSILPDRAEMFEWMRRAYSNTIRFLPDPKTNAVGAQPPQPDLSMNNGSRQCLRVWSVVQSSEADGRGSRLCGACVCDMDRYDPSRCKDCRHVRRTVAKEVTSLPAGDILPYLGPGHRHAPCGGGCQCPASDDEACDCDGRCKNEADMLCLYPHSPRAELSDAEYLVAQLSHMYLNHAAMCYCCMVYGDMDNCLLRVGEGTFSYPRTVGSCGKECGCVSRSKRTKNSVAMVKLSFGSLPRDIFGTCCCPFRGQVDRIFWRKLPNVQPTLVGTTSSVHERVMRPNANQVNNGIPRALKPTVVTKHEPKLKPAAGEGGTVRVACGDLLSMVRGGVNETYNPDDRDSNGPSSPPPPPKPPRPATPPSTHGINDMVEDNLYSNTAGNLIRPPAGSLMGQVSVMGEFSVRAENKVVVDSDEDEDELFAAVESEDSSELVPPPRTPPPIPKKPPKTPPAIETKSPFPDVQTANRLHRRSLFAVAARKAAGRPTTAFPTTLDMHGNQFGIDGTVTSRMREFVSFGQSLWQRFVAYQFYWEGSRSGMGYLPGNTWCPCDLLSCAQRKEAHELRESLAGASIDGKHSKDETERFNHVAIHRFVFPQLSAADIVSKREQVNALSRPGCAVNMATHMPLLFPAPVLSEEETITFGDVNDKQALPGLAKFLFAPRGSRSKAKKRALSVHNSSTADSSDAATSHDQPNKSGGTDTTKGQSDSAKGPSDGAKGPAESKHRTTKLVCETDETDPPAEFKTDNARTAHSLSKNPPYLMPPVPRGKERWLPIWCGSWNMGAKTLSDDDRAALERILPLHCRLYVMGVQEAKDESLFDAMEDAFEARHGLIKRLANTSPKVAGRGDGSFISTKYTGITVFVDASLENCVHVLGSKAIPMGMTEGSKGGVCVVLRIFQTRIAFISTHLSSKTVADRRAGFKRVTSKAGATLGDTHFHLLEQVDHVVWVGDLNYRLACSVPVAKQLMAAGEITTLRTKDELFRERVAGGAFSLFREPAKHTAFMPSYKRLPAKTRKFPMPIYDMDANLNSLVYRSNLQFTSSAEQKDAWDAKSTTPPSKQWIDDSYITMYKEPWYKTGRVKARVPSYCDRVMIHSQYASRGHLQPAVNPLYLPCPPAIGGGGGGGRIADDYMVYDNVLRTSDHCMVAATLLMAVDVAPQIDDKTEKLIKNQGGARRIRDRNIRSNIVVGNIPVAPSKPVPRAQSGVPLRGQDLTKNTELARKFTASSLRGRETATASAAQRAQEASSQLSLSSSAHTRLPQAVSRDATATCLVIERCASCLSSGPVESWRKRIMDVYSVRLESVEVSFEVPADSALARSHAAITAARTLQQGLTTSVAQLTQESRSTQQNSAGRAQQQPLPSTSTSGSTTSGSTTSGSKKVPVVPAKKKAPVVPVKRDKQPSNPTGPSVASEDVQASSSSSTVLSTHGESVGSERTAEGQSQPPSANETSVSTESNGRAESPDAVADAFTSVIGEDRANPPPPPPALPQSPAPPQPQTVRMPFLPLPQYVPNDRVLKRQVRLRHNAVGYRGVRVVFPAPFENGHSLAFAPKPDLEFPDQTRFTCVAPKMQRCLHMLLKVKVRLGSRTLTGQCSIRISRRQFHNGERLFGRFPMTYHGIPTTVRDRIVLLHVRLVPTRRSL